MKHSNCFIAASYFDRDRLKPVLETIKRTLGNRGINPLVYVETKNAPDDPHEMMTEALHMIKNSSMLIAEVSRKSIGVGIEVGYAHAQGLPVVYIRHRDAHVSLTTRGVSTYEIIYDSLDDLDLQLNEVIKRLECDTICVCPTK